MSNFLFKVPRVEPVKLTIESGKRKYFFPNLSVFDKGVLVGLGTFRVAELPRTPDGAVLLNNAQLEGAFITLFGKDNRQIMQQVPLIELVRSENAGVFYLTHPVAINWQKSFIEVEPNATLVPGEAAFFNLYYFLESDEVPETNPRTMLGTNLV